MVASTLRRGSVALRQRWRLLRLLRHAGAGCSSGAVGLLLLTAAAPTLQAYAAGAFVGSLAGAGLGPAVGTAALLAAAVLIGEGSLLGYEVCAAVAGRQIDGRVRRVVRRVAGTPAGIEHLESTEFQEDVTRASDNGQDFGRVRSPGTAAVGQLLVLSRYLTAVVGAVVVATYSVWLAIGLLAVAQLVRLRATREWAYLASVKDKAIANQRRLGYLTGLVGAAAVKEVRLFGLATWLLARRRATAYGTNAAHWRAIVTVLSRQWWPGAALTVAAAATLALPALAALRGELGAAAMVRLALAGFVVLTLSQLGPEAFDIDYGAGAVAAVDRLEARYPATVTAIDPPPAATDPRPPTIRFEDVTFHYPGHRDRPVLAGLTLTIRPGETLAVVGANGAGKTTMVKLLAGLYRPTAGRITVDGTDLAARDVETWRHGMTALFQDFVRYPATLADNIALSAPEAIDDRAGLLAAVRRAGAEDLLGALPDGLDSSLWREGTAGADLSGGQWQRVAIARALFAVAHGRRLLVLDEPTAHLDVRAEAEFYRRVASAVAGAASTVLISHRLSTIRPANRIVLVRDGRVAESGTHDELMALGGDYHRLFTLQAAPFADDPDDAVEFGRPTPGGAS